MLRTSERKLYKQCRQRWWWEYVDCLKPVDEAPALRFGSLVHEALALWYVPGRQRGVHPARSFETLYVAQIDQGLEDFGVRLDEEKVWADALPLGIEMLNNFVDLYGDDDHINVISPEMAVQIPIHNPRNGKFMFMYVGSLDLVFEDLSLRQIGLMETKTAASISTTHLPLDEQAGSYWAIAPEFLQAIGVLPADTDIDFIQYNFLRKGFKDERPTNEKGQHLNKPSKEKLLEWLLARGISNKRSTTVPELMAQVEANGQDPLLLGEPSKSQPPPLFLRHKVYRDEYDRAELLRRIRMEGWEMDQVRRGNLPVYKNPSGSFPDQHCKSCGFRDMCELHETGADWEALRDATMRTWDPYEDHNDEKEEIDAA